MTNCHQLLSSTTTTVDPHDTVAHVIELAASSSQDFLPVLDGLQYLGLVSATDAEDADPNAEIITLQHLFLKPFVSTGDHFLQALRVRAKFFVDIVPVLNEKNEWEGIIHNEKLLDQLAALNGVTESGSIVVLEMPRQDYAPGLINRLVESNDAMVMHFNTVQDHHSGTIQVVLRINKEEVSAIVATFQRHEFTVLYHYGEERYDNTLQQNLDHLLNYLNI